MQCKDCGKAIAWLKMLPSEKTPKPKPAPIETEGSPSGNLVVSWEKRLYRFATPEERDIAQRENKNLYRNHFATCINAKRFRKES